MVQFIVYRHACIGRLMFNMHVQRGIWYADDAAHMFLVGVIAPVLIAVCGACANWTTPVLHCAPNIVARGGSKQRLPVWAYVWAYVWAQRGSAV